MFLTGGFPSASQPAKSIFNLRAAQGLAALVDLHVVHLRYWRPGRSARSSGTYAGLHVDTVALPYSPPASLTLPALTPLWCRIARRALAPIMRDVDVIHSVGVDLGGIVGAHLARRFDRPHLAQTIGTDLHFNLPSLLRNPLLRKWERGVDLVLCNSDALQAEWRRQYPAGSSAVTRYRGTDLSRYDAPVLRDDSAQRFLFLGGYVNRTSTDFGADLKGGTTLMKAWSDADQHPDFEGELVFGGPNGEAREVAQWRSSLRHPERVRLCGLLAPEEVRGALRQTDILLLPSRSEGLPNLAVEAAASRRVVLGSRVGGVPEIVVDGETGLLLPAGDVAAWREAILDAASGRYPLTTWSADARARAERLFDHRRYPEAIVELYEKLLASEPTRQPGAHV